MEKNGSLCLGGHFDGGIPGRVGSSWSIPLICVPLLHNVLPVCVCGMCVCRDFSTEVDIALRKWAEDIHKLPSICALAAQETILKVLRTKIEVSLLCQDVTGCNWILLDVTGCYCM